ncbi:MAG: DMT family transporter [Chloroflexota bacterium]
MRLNLSPYNKGLLITALGVLIITPDGLLTRLIGADTWSYVFWRGLLFGGSICLGTIVMYRRQSWAHFRALGWAGLLVAAVFAVGSIMFVFAFTTTAVANTLFIINTSPIFAAIIGWYFLKEAVPIRTRITIVVVLIGISIIAFGSDAQSGNLLGNLAALGAAISIAVGFILARYFRDIDMVPAVGLGGLMMAAVTIPWASPAAIAPDRWPYMLLVGLIILPISFSLMYIGPRYLPAAEVSLMMLLEAILGPLFVWLALGENPGVPTLIGGAIILTALALNTALPLLFSKNLNLKPS